jgi:hypothetical protein
MLLARLGMLFHHIASVVASKDRSLTQARRTARLQQPNREPTNAEPVPSRQMQHSESARDTNNQTAALTAQALDHHNARQAPPAGYTSPKYFDAQSSYPYLRFNDYSPVGPLNSTYYTTEQKHTNNAFIHEDNAGSGTTYDLPSGSTYSTPEFIHSMSTRRLDGMSGGIDLAGIGSQFNFQEYCSQGYSAKNPTLGFQEAAAPYS